jgi:hypothetical protein
MKKLVIILSIAVPLTSQAVSGCAQMEGDEWVLQILLARKAKMLNDTPMAILDNKILDGEIRSREHLLKSSTSICKLEREISEKRQQEDAAERAAIATERERRAKLPGVRIGMTQKQVVESTDWGRPDAINRTVTKRGASEQWVYQDGRAYLYFNNGRVTAIQQ